MRWGDMRRSENVEDRGGMSGGFGGGMPLGGGMKIGGGTLIVIVILSLIFGINPLTFLGMGAPEVGSPPPAPSAPSRQAPAPDGRATAPTDQRKDFAARIVGDTEDVWGALFKATNRGGYAPTTLTLYRGAVRSGCGTASSAAGPFYCPADQRVYLDTAFFDELSRRFGAPGDFAQAYVIAHEVGHHVQNLLGISEKVEAAKRRAGERGANQLSVQLELQADCLAGVWAYHAEKTRQILEQGDVEEALNAASAIGDDRLQKQSQGHVTPDSFTHGSSAQRVQWFRRGLESGRVDQCDTFATAPRRS
jgi:predicted metalloprotease